MEGFRQEKKRNTGKAEWESSAVRAQEVSRFLPSLPDGRQLPEGLKVMAPKLSPKAPGLLPHGHRIKSVAAGERGETKRVS